MTDEARSNQSDYELVNSISVAAFDVDARIFRTLWHSLIRAPGVTLAAIRGDYTRYISPVRVLIALFGIQFGLAAIFGSPMTPTVETLAPQVTPERFAFGTVMRITGLVLILPVTFLISAACQILAVSWILDSQFDLGLLGLFQS
ncbi:DUF3667 domain-containing protein [Maricaulis sp.]|uniref:DUF3667 domain-containing protein n=1 Tax=Maricaulis sp. TaxID=1486257 RepID=UPI003A922C08